jgi:hypothetical protein
MGRAEEESSRETWENTLLGAGIFLRKEPEDNAGIYVR